LTFALFCGTLSIVSLAGFISHRGDLMKTDVHLDAIYTPSEDVVFRDIEGELIIVPLTWGVGGAEDEQDAIFTLNEWGRAIWDRLDGQRSLKDVVAELTAEFEAAEGKIEADVLGLVGELVKRKMLVEVSGV
jgi:hypothetical protein